MVISCKSVVARGHSVHNQDCEKTFSQIFFLTLGKYRLSYAPDTLDLFEAISGGLMPVIMHPEILTEDILSDKKRKAELEVYFALKKTLTDGFHVFYNCNWLDPHQQSNRYDGEADFVIAHEKFGYIVLEVKGGIISRDEKSQQWCSNKIYEIKDPVQQALDSKHVIFKKLKNILGNNIGLIRRRHAVVFPGSGKPKSKSDLGAGMPLDIFMFLDDMPSLGSKVIEVLLNDPPDAVKQYAPLRKAGIDGLIKLFSQGFSLEPRLRTTIGSCEFKILEITQQQKKILKLTENNKRMRISGGAGTGKTSLAIEKAKLLAQSGHSVLFLCFNIPLSKYLNRILDESENIHIHAHYQFCLKVATEANIPLPDKNSEKYWEEVPYILLDALEKKTDMRYDAVIVDEGQDFKDEWIESLENCLKDRDNGFFYVFYDDNQRIYNQSTGGLQKIANTSLHLFENVRNSKPIFAGSSAFYQGGTLESLGPEGLDIEWIEAEQQRDKKLEKILNKLINTEGISKSEIAVLTARSYKNYENFSVGKYEFCRADDINSNYIVLDSIHRFKGLEKQVVILIDLNVAFSKGRSQLLYVGFSRARSLLFIIDDAETIKDLKSYTKIV